MEHAPIRPRVRPAARPTLPRRLLTAVLTVALGAALGLVPMASAHAETTVIPTTVIPLAAIPTTAIPTTSPSCSDAYQIGTTGYIYYGSAIVASVKQFYSPRCQKNWGYVWVWESFRERRIPYDVGVAVYSYTAGQPYGRRYVTNASGAAFWSDSANTVPHCTAGQGFLLFNDQTPAEEYSSKRC